MLKLEFGHLPIAVDGAVVQSRQGTFQRRSHASDDGILGRVRLQGVEDGIEPNTRIGSYTQFADIGAIQPQYDGVDQGQHHMGNGVAAITPRVNNMASQNIAQLQQLKKFVEKVDVAKMRQTRMITGNLEVSRRSSHSEPYLTKSEVRLRVAKMLKIPINSASGALLGPTNAPNAIDGARPAQPEWHGRTWLPKLIDDREFTLETVPDAYRWLASGKAQGKVVIDVANLAPETKEIP